MSKAREMAEILSTPPAIYSTDAEVAATYLTLASASTIYQTKTSTGLTLLTPGSITNTGGTASIGANGTVTFSGVATQSINNVFTSTYDNYRFILNCVQSNTVGLYMNMRTGSTNTLTGYAQAGWSYKSDGATSVFGNNANRNEVYLGDGDTNEEMYVGDIQKPFLSSNTAIQHQGMASYQNKALVSTTILKNSTSYDAIRIFPGSGNITGTISIYGYNK